MSKTLPDMVNIGGTPLAPPASVALGKGALINSDFNVPDDGGSGGSGEGGSLSVTPIAGTYTVGVNDVVILAFGGAYSITLPAPVWGRSLYIKDAAGSSVSLPKTILPHGAETIDGGASYILDIDFAAIHLVADGTNWYVLTAYNGTVV